MIKLRVYGVPVPQGSTRAFAVRKGGRPTGPVVVTGDNAKTKSWRQAIIDAVEADRPFEGILSPVSVLMVFILPRPAGHYGTGKNAARVRPAAPAWPAARPDVDKLARAVLDALTDAGVWRDDSQVASLAAVKIYASYDERPGALIEVDALRKAVTVAELETWLVQVRG